VLEFFGAAGPKGHERRFSSRRGAADGLFDAFLSGSLTAPAQRRLNRNCVKCELTEQESGAEHVCMVSGRLTQSAGDD
jgi:hypothetical protein